MTMVLIIIFFLLSIVSLILLKEYKNSYQNYRKDGASVVAATLLCLFNEE